MGSVAVCVCLQRAAARDDAAERDAALHHGWQHGRRGRHFRVSLRRRGRRRLHRLDAARRAVYHAASYDTCKYLMQPRMTHVSTSCSLV